MVIDPRLAHALDDGLAAAIRFDVPPLRIPVNSQESLNDAERINDPDGLPHVSTLRRSVHEQAARNDEGIGSEQ